LSLLLKRPFERAQDKYPGHSERGGIQTAAQKLSRHFGDSCEGSPLFSLDNERYHMSLSFGLARTKVDDTILRLFLQIQPTKKLPSEKRLGECSREKFLHYHSALPLHANPHEGERAAPVS